MQGLALEALCLNFYFQRFFPFFFLSISTHAQDFAGAPDQKVLALQKQIVKLELKRFSQEITKRQVNNRPATEIFCRPDTPRTRTFYRYVTDSKTGLIRSFVAVYGDNGSIEPERELKIQEIVLGKEITMTFEGGWRVNIAYSHNGNILVSSSGDYFSPSAHLCFFR